MQSGNNNVQVFFSFADVGYLNSWYIILDHLFVMSRLRKLFIRFQIPPKLDKKVKGKIVMFVTTYKFQCTQETNKYIDILVSSYSNERLACAVRQQYTNRTIVDALNKAAKRLC